MHTIKVPANLIGYINWSGIAYQNKSEGWNWAYSVVKLSLAGDWRLLLRVSAECQDRAYDRGCHARHCSEETAKRLAVFAERINTLIEMRPSRDYRLNYVRTQSEYKETPDENNENLSIDA